MSSLLNALAEWVIRVVESLGYIGVAGLLALETVFPPIPSEVVLPLAGFLTGQGRLSFIGVMIAATLGGLFGATALYTLSRWLGEPRLRSVVQHYGRYALVEERDIDRALDWFHRYGTAAVFFGRLAPLIRSLISIPAGFAAMKLPRFLLYTFLGTVTWNGILIGAGWFPGDRWEAVQDYAKPLEYAVIALIVAAVVLFVVRRGLSQLRRPADDQPQ